MSLETSIDALVHDFEIEDVRDEVPTAEKSKDSSVQDSTSPQVQVSAIPQENPMSFLEDASVLTQTVSNTSPALPDNLDAVDDEDGPSIADLKKRVKKDHSEIVAIEKEVKIQQRYDLEDRAYMKAQLKSLISDNRAVMDCIESQLKIGVNPHLFDIYANLSKTVADNIMRLAKIDETITNYKIVEDKGTGNIKHDVAKDQGSGEDHDSHGNLNMQINNYNLGSSSDLLKFVKSLMPKTEKVRQEDLPKFNLQ